MPSTAAAKPIRLALVGAGIFMRDAHVPALQQIAPQFEIVAVHSRTLESASALAHQLGPEVEATNDLAGLLARADIEAVDIVLPIPSQPEVLHQALAAGKHVISEKPIAPGHGLAQQLIDVHATQRGQVWMIAENWRYEEAFVRAAALLAQGVIGRPIAAHWAQYTAMTPKNKYYKTQWRRSGAFPGGFLVDGGVHHAAVLRMLLGEPVAAQAVIAQFAPDLPPYDTVVATLRFTSGALATYLNTFAVSTPFSSALTIAGDAGSLRVERGRIEVANAQGEVQVTECEYYTGVRDELAAFGVSIRTGQPHKNTPEQTLGDLRLMESILTAAQSRVVV